MARLLREPWPWIRRDSFLTTESYAEERRALERLRASEAMAICPVADGAAYYVVVKRRPLTLRWVPFGDCWHAPGAWIRGLRASDIVEAK